MAIERVDTGLVLDSSSQVIAISSTDSGVFTDTILSRFNTAGSLDSSFIDNGHSRINHGPSNDWLLDGLSLTASPNSGKLLMVGGTNTNQGYATVLAARYTSTGALDTAFADSGYLSIRLPGDSVINAVAEAGNGQLVMVGTSNAKGLVLVTDANGKLQSGFDSDGIKYVTSDKQLSFADVVLEGERIVIAGTEWADDGSAGDSDLYLTALTLTSGSQDSSFNGGSPVISNLGQGEKANALALAGSGNYIVAGDRFANSQTPDSQGLIAKFTLSGSSVSLDSSFNGNGFFTVDADSSVTGNNDTLEDVKVATNGNIYALGASRSTTGNNTLIFALTANGSADSSFAGNGVGLFGFGLSTASNGLALDASGNLLVTGQNLDGTNGGSDLFLARITTTGAMDVLFNAGDPFTQNYNNTDSVSLLLTLADGSIVLGGHNAINGYSQQVWYLQRFNLVQ